ncbi:sugar 3,4-ketoisomerase [Streptomyces sp. NPDC059104]|uniref:sugar 3,4-ketoisomerase n=1 Tax=unclassified Streptomyces TaxID=2593676 RepID=UPI00224FB9FF
MAVGTTTETKVGRIKPCAFIDLEQHNDERGKLSVVESGATTGFPIRRVYYLHDADAGASRGSHAHRELEQLVIAVHGSFTITVDDGFGQASYVLDDPGRGLYIGPMVWRQLSGFSEGAVCVVLASLHYDESDYHRDYEAFLADARRWP